MTENILDQLREAAHQFDVWRARPENIGVHSRYGDVHRDADVPPYVQMDAAGRARATQNGWYISPEDMNRRGPDRFIALGGMVVKRSEHGFVNPYGPTGLTGPGILGFGTDADGNPIPESRAVDIVIQFIDPTDGLLKFIGGIRGDTGQPCFVGGFQEQDALTTAVREFIEESISGSLDLAQLAPLLHEACALRRANTALPEEAAACLQTFDIDAGSFSGDEGEATYHFIRYWDPAFVTALTDYFRDCLSVAYRGPCRADPRTTDQRWIATTMLTGLVDLPALDKIMKDRKFPYAFVAGSDLTDVKRHIFDATFVTTAFASHGPLACLATAHNLAPRNDVSTLILDQCRAAIAAINKIIAQPAPPSSVVVTPLSSATLI